MNAARLLSALVGAVSRRPALTLGAAGALGLAGAVLALGLSPSAATSTFVSSSSPQYRATQRFYESFGEEPVAVVVKGNLEQMLLSSDIDRLLGLEGCLSGNVPTSALAAEGGAHGPCAKLAQGGTVKVVLGPGTFVNEAAEQIGAGLIAQNRQAETQARESRKAVADAALARGLGEAQAHQLGEQAYNIVMARFREGVAKLALQYGITGTPSLDEPGFVEALVFDSRKVAGTPKERFAYLFPNRDAALISVRMKAGLSQAQREHTIGLIREAVAMRQWRLQHGESYLVTGEPVIVADLTGAIGHSMELLLIAVLLVMAIVLGLVFRVRPRLLPLAVALLAAALTFGGLALVGASLTVAQVAVLPILVGLSVDYAIQFQSRVCEALAGGAGDTRAAIRAAAGAGGPTIATACLATAGATLVLLASPVPMVRGFGVLLAVGVVVAFVCAMTAGAAALALTGAPRGESLPARPRPRALVALAAAWRGARELLGENVLTRAVSRAALVHAVRRPGRVLAAGLALAAVGWGVDTQTRVQTDITKLVPQDMASLRNLDTLERLSGVGGEIDLMVSAPDVAKPATIEWMSSYERNMLARFGYSEKRGCGRARLCPAFSLPDLFQQEGSRHGKLTKAQVNGLLAAIPPYFSQDVLAPGRHTATLAFGIRLMGLDEQQRVIEAMRAGLNPPAGVSAQLVGLPVLAAQANAQVASPWRRLLTLLASLAAVALVLLIAFRGNLRRAFAPLAPIVLASGWSALVLFLVRVPLNPMSVTLGALVIAISTEFSVLLAERHRQERLAGCDTAEALRRTYRHTGAAVAASGVTAIAGFGVLALSNIAMLRDFGLVTLIDLTVSLLGVLIALPAALMLWQGALDAESRGGEQGVWRGRIAPLSSRRRRPEGRAGHELA
ncbi:MAG TPA: MMPL family transporter [Solirubrobacteraceae bacterium]|nr:MMPL family transporter [Solirubrobacteraceae bacterium]